MSDETFPLPTEVPASRITYTVNISQGRQLGFETMVDQTIANEDLDELLDRVTRSYNRQQAILELPEMERQQSLARTLLKEKVKDRAAMPDAHLARLAALAQERETAAAKLDRPREGRRNAAATPADHSRVAQIDHQMSDAQSKHLADLDIADKDIEALRLQIDVRQEAIERARRLIGHTAPDLGLTALAAE